LAAEQPEHPARLFGEAVEREGAAGALASAPQAEALEEEAACLQRRLLEVQIEALQAQARREDAEAKHLHLQSVAQALQLCEQVRVYGKPEIRRAGERGCERRDAAARAEPRREPGCRPVPADARPHPCAIVPHGREFGKALKLARATLQGQAAPTTTQDWGPEEREIFQYSRQEDRE
jgi:hypothetical protein